MTEQNIIAPDQTFLPQQNGEVKMTLTILNNDPALHSHLPFVHKLFILLQDMEAKGYDHIISWIGDGKAFKIHNPSLFEASIQPKYFRQSRVASFIRQVSLEFLARQKRFVSDVNLILAGTTCTSYSCSYTVTVLPRSKTKATSISERTCIQTFREITQHELVRYNGEVPSVEIEDSKAQTQWLGFIEPVLVVPKPMDTTMIHCPR